MYNLILKQKNPHFPKKNSVNQLELSIPVKFCFCGSFKKEITLKHKFPFIAYLSNSLTALLCANLEKVTWWC